MSFPPRLQNGFGPDRAQIQCDLVGQHFLKPESEEVWGIPAVGPGCHITSESSRSTWTAMASSTTVGQPGANGQGGIHIATAVA
jgi:hypothetical protein